MIFAKPSTRTRTSFEVGIHQLGGHAIYMKNDTMHLGKNETIADTARVMNRYVDGIVARLFSHSDIEELAANSTFPVVNALTDSFHPCQALGDIFTIQEKFGKFEDITLSYIGDANNNVCHSLLLACSKVGINIKVICPTALSPKIEVAHLANQFASDSNSKVEILHIPEEAQDSDIIYTDVWVSMGQEKQAALVKRKRKLLRPYQVNSKFVSYVNPNAKIMHCLPAHRGEEITDEVIDSPNSVVFDQAENRLHVQKAILIKLFKGR